MKALLMQLRWQFVILHKNKLIAISFAVTALYAILFYLIKDLPNIEPFLTLLIYNDPAVIGLFFVGLSVIMEKNDNVLHALFVTPINYHVYLISRVMALSIVGWVCAVAMTLAMLGPTINWLHFSAGAVGTCAIFSLAGVFVVSYTTEFLNFMLRSIPVLVFLSLPLFNYFGITDFVVFEFTPVQGPLNLIISSFHTTVDMNSIYIGYVSSSIWIPLLYFGAYRVFVNRIIKAN